MNKREKERRNARQRAFRERLQRADDGLASDDPDQQEAIPSEFGIMLYEDFINSINPGQVILSGRTSSASNRKHLPGQCSGACERIEVQGVYVAEVVGFERVQSGKTLEPEKRPDLVAAREAARKLAQPVVVFPTFCRILRHPDYHPEHNPDARPTVGQLKALKKLFGDVVICTLFDPDEPPAEGVKHLAELGREAGGNLGGRPRKYRSLDGQTKSACNSLIDRLSEQGLHSRQIARRVLCEMRVKVSHATICKVVKALAGCKVCSPD